jgi:hypothetical protein
MPLRNDDDAESVARSFALSIIISRFGARNRAQQPSCIE